MAVRFVLVLMFCVAAATFVTATDAEEDAGAHFDEEEAFMSGNTVAPLSRELKKTRRNTVAAKGAAEGAGGKKPKKDKSDTKPEEESYWDKYKYKTFFGIARQLRKTDDTPGSYRRLVKSFPLKDDGSQYYPALRKSSHLDKIFQSKEHGRRLL